MSAPELVELKLQLQELIEKWYPTQCVSLGSIDIVCKEGWYDADVYRLPSVEQND